MLTCCGENVILDIINEEEYAFCPKCGKDWSYEYYQAVTDAESAQAKRCFGNNEIPSHQ